MSPSVSSASVDCRRVVLAAPICRTAVGCSSVYLSCSSDSSHHPSCSCRLTTTPNYAAARHSVRLPAAACLHVSDVACLVEPRRRSEGASALLALENRHCRCSAGSADASLQRDSPLPVSLAGLCRLRIASHDSCTASSTFARSRSCFLRLSILRWARLRVLAPRLRI